MAMNNLGRDKIDWSQDIWNAIDQAVHDEALHHYLYHNHRLIQVGAPSHSITIAPDIEVLNTLHN